MGQPVYDRVFLQRLCSGDEDAFEQVFRACYASVYGVAYRLLRDSPAAEEVAQEAFVRLHRTPPTGAEPPNLLGWLITVATHLSYNRLRSERRRREREERAGRLEEATEAPADPVERQDAVERVRRVLAELPPRLALLLLLRHSGLSYAEIARQLDVAPGSVGTLLVRAERSFRQRYEQLEQGDSDGEHS
ncbi:MAG: sigma-70 family RNA polymerase sigma factor [Anaerolineae bacterium]